MAVCSVVSEEGDVSEAVVPRGTESVDIGGKRYKRWIVNEGLSIGCLVSIPTPAEQVKQGYHKLEQTEGSSLLRKSQFSTKQIKKAWGF